MKIKIELVRNENGHYALPDDPDKLNFFCGTFVRQCMGYKPKKLELVIGNRVLRICHIVEYRYKPWADYRLCWRNALSHNNGSPGLTHANFCRYVLNAFGMDSQVEKTGTAYLQFIDKD